MNEIRTIAQSFKSLRHISKSFSFNIVIRKRIWDKRKRANIIFLKESIDILRKLVIKEPILKQSIQKQKQPRNRKKIYNEKQQAQLMDTVIKIMEENKPKIQREPPKVMEHNINFIERFKIN